MLKKLFNFSDVLSEDPRKQICETIQDQEQKWGDLVKDEEREERRMDMQDALEEQIQDDYQDYRDTAINQLNSNK